MISIKVPWTPTLVTPEENEKNDWMGDEKDWMGKEKELMGKEKQ